ncbi:MAG: substrate-binding domain-containing protein [Defluviitaleaceae bacterium]|nr:substrate-binding domain-containing protein [Defluviitaleaceae bacterium]
MKKFRLLGIVTALTGAMLLTGCGGSNSQASQQSVSGFNVNRAINVISREDGSGTRGAFIELLGIEIDGVDHTSSEADIANGTSVVITSVSGNIYAIGYISLGSLNNTVSAVSIEGVPASPETVQDGSYPIFRSFNLAIGNLNAVAQDFLDFVLSAEGQAIVVAGGYISVDATAPAFAGGGASGNVVITGSTSVAPVMERIAEAYMTVNPSANVEVHSSGSGAGITAARDGTADIGMSSRALHAHELEVVDSITVAHDGLAIIVNNNNPLENLSVEEIRQVFMGNIHNWSDLLN